MRRPPSSSLAIGAGILAVFVALGVSLSLAWMRSLSAEEQRVAEYARGVLRRSEEVGEQSVRGDVLLRNSGFAPCSAQEVELMRQIDLGSSYIQMVARQAGNDLICTSRGDTIPIPVGPIDVVTDAGTGIRIGRSLSRFSNDPMIILSHENFAILVNPVLIFDVPMEDERVSLTTVVPSAKLQPALGFTGQAPTPVRFVKKGGSLSYVDGDDVVVVVRSAKFDVEAVAREPKAYAMHRLREFVLVMAPIGLLGGGVLAWALIYLSQIYFSMPSMLRAAARRHDFYVEYQPIVDLASRRWIGAEALVRWERSGKPVLPDVFIPIAEESGVIGSITSEVLAIVARDLPRLTSIDPDFQVSINLSGEDLRSRETLVKLDCLLRESGCSAANIDVEITERSFLHDRETQEGMAEIRGRGFTISIDDFGTGYSNLASLQRLQIDTLKIDKTFVDTIGASATSDVVLHIIRMALALKLDLVAEGVETEAQAAFLRAQGVEYAQGWLFSRSLPIHELCDRMPGHVIAMKG